MEERDRVQTRSVAEQRGSRIELDLAPRVVIDSIQHRFGQRLAAFIRAACAGLCIGDEPLIRERLRLTELEPRSSERSRWESKRSAEQRKSTGGQDEATIRHLCWDVQSAGIQ